MHVYGCLYAYNSYNSYNSYTHTHTHTHTPSYQYMPSYKDSSVILFFNSFLDNLSNETRTSQLAVRVHLLMITVATELCIRTFFGTRFVYNK